MPPIKIKEQIAQIGRGCEICDGFIPVPYGKSNRSLCEECCKRLKGLLYPETGKEVDNTYE